MEDDPQPWVSIVILLQQSGNKTLFFISRKLAKFHVIQFDSISIFTFSLFITTIPFLSSRFYKYLLSFVVCFSFCQFELLIIQTTEIINFFLIIIKAQIR